MFFQPINHRRMTTVICSAPQRLNKQSGAAVGVVDGVVEIARIDEEGRLALRAAAVCW